ncbi:DNA polymerase III subunit theta [Pantoea eucrina]|uniref:DNA polymerase III subunit theta n=1 Tax=Pantoea eucrina TaxID=472693 RepID=UPI000A261F3B|nr:DNA polymerase III subunit theta [Pantoea eucrina]ORM78903.1 DNA polymerase III subunit theta [Pantoea eucrina]
MTFNLAAGSKEECERINVDLATAGVAYKERLNMPALPVEVERQQSEAFREYFRKRLAYYRQKALDFPRGNDPVYLKEVEKSSADGPVITQVSVRR